MSEKSGAAGRTRASDTAQRRVLDAATRQRRQKKQLEMLEKDNSHEDPHNSLAQLSSKAKLPTFAETSDGRKRKKTRSNADHFKQRFRKTFQTLLEELPPEAQTQPSYITAVVPPSNFPSKHFCAVCGYPNTMLS
ncbi:Zinc finger HIT domain-containing protein 1 [Geodia barretti]|uniref:Zinc finger HIT domain-containing protein 1 n=1 Tax=Geodia barretti TaxID=519541 RepID=A0AA35W0T9_GEOBA|nr:Zinc finger HIT domain-containing protein 1 [Geodia barretti]